MNETHIEMLRTAVGPMSGTISIGNVSVPKEALTVLLAEHDALMEREQKIKALADSWAACTWRPYENPAHELQSILSATP